jgi:hypothetical protein
MPRYRVLEAISRAKRLPRAAWLSRRTRVRGTRLADEYRDKYGIHSLAPVSAYRSFLAAFKPVTAGPFRLDTRKAGTEALTMIAFSRFVRRPLQKSTKIRLGALGKLRVPLPSNPFRMKFSLTSGIEPRLSLPFDRSRPAAVCAVMGWQGPSPKKYPDSLGLRAELERHLHEPWPNFALKTLVEHARRQGMSAVALLRPEHNPAISREKLRRAGRTAPEIETLYSQYYAAARKAGLKRKIDGSHYIWLFF